MKLRWLLIPLFLAGLVAASVVSARPPDFCSRHPQNPNCQTTSSATTTASSSTSTTVPTTTTAPTTTTVPTTTTPPPPAGGDVYGFATGAPSIISATFNSNASTRTACSNTFGSTDPYACYAKFAKSVRAQVLRGDAGGTGTPYNWLRNAAVANGILAVPSWNMKWAWTDATAQQQAQMVVSTYPDTRRVELGNEPNGAWSNGNNCPVDLYWAMKITGFVKAMSPILRSGLPGVYLISPGLADYGSSDNCHMTPQSFLTAELNNSIDAYVDCYGYHPYSDFDWQTQLPAMVKILRDRGILKPLCITETGVDTLLHTEAAEAAAVTNRLSTAKASGDIADVDWYSLHDHCSSCTGSREDRFGVFRTDWSKKPAADAFAAAVP